MEKQDKEHEKVLLHLLPLEGLWGIERALVEHGKVKESENKKMRQRGEVLQVKNIDWISDANCL